jgi:hypothetical protein
MSIAIHMQRKAENREHSHLWEVYSLAGVILCTRGLSMRGCVLRFCYNVWHSSQRGFHPVTLPSFSANDNYDTARALDTAVASRKSFLISLEREKRRVLNRQLLLYRDYGYVTHQYNRAERMREHVSVSEVYTRFEAEKLRRFQFAWRERCERKERHRTSRLIRRSPKPVPVQNFVSYSRFPKLFSPSVHPENSIFEDKLSSVNCHSMVGKSNDGSASDASFKTSWMSKAPFLFFFNGDLFRAIRASSSAIVAGNTTRGACGCFAILADKMMSFRAIVAGNTTICFC